MIRHPFLLVVEALSALAIAAVAQLGLNRPQPKPAALHIALTALGEREQPDGSWQGVDLLRDPDAHADRVQLSLRTTAAAQVLVDAVESAGVHRVFPLPGQSGVLRPGVSYGLPAPHQFYEVQGKLQLRVQVRPLTGEASLEPAVPLTDIEVRPYPLSDGAPFEVTEQAFATPSGGTITLNLR